MIRAIAYSFGWAIGFFGYLVGVPKRKLHVLAARLRARAKGMRA